eukprot:748837-Hanusia_phi.AAC.4
MEGRKFRLAAVMFKVAHQHDPGSEWILWYLAMAHEFASSWREAAAAYKDWLLLQRDAKGEGYRRSRSAGRKVVAILCVSKTPNEYGGTWGSQSLERGGIGGSEEAVIYISRELVQRGYHVEVFAYPAREEVGTDKHGVVWLPVSSFFADELPPPDVLVSWRCYALAAAAGGAKTLNYLWLHDRVMPSHLPPSLVDNLSGILVLSSHHRSQLPRHAQVKAIPTSNGLAASFWEDGPNQYNDFIFASHPVMLLVA